MVKSSVGKDLRYVSAFLIAHLRSNIVISFCHLDLSYDALLRLFSISVKRSIKATSSEDTFFNFRRYSKPKYLSAASYLILGSADRSIVSLYNLATKVIFSLNHMIMRFSFLLKMHFSQTNNFLKNRHISQLLVHNSLS